MASPQNRDYERLAKLAKSRRATLGVALNDDNAKAAATSKGTWQRVEKGLPIRGTNYVKIDRLLRWAPGSCAAVLEGGEPVPVDEVEGAPDVQKSPLPRGATEEEMLGIVQLALVATTKGTTAEEIREISERIVHDLREGGIG